MDNKFTLVECKVPKQLDLLIHNQKTRSLSGQVEALKKYNKKTIQWCIHQFKSTSIAYDDLNDHEEYGPAPQYITPMSSLYNWFTFEVAFSILNQKEFNNFSYFPSKGDLISFTSTFVYKPLKNIPRSEPRFNAMYCTFEDQWKLDTVLRIGNSKMVKQGLLLNNVP